MTGLYIHIPFCATRCSYCDFYSQTNSALRSEYIQALIAEMSIRRTEVADTIGTLYFGGGTPSLLSPQEIGRIIEQAYKLFSFSSDVEITLEANPDDLNTGYVQELRTLPINRISMGAQSFHDEDLHFLNRRHNARQVYEAVDTCRKAGLTNLSIDLIYGLPGQTPARWQENISAVLALAPPHLSAYHLIYEEGTPLTRLLHAGKVREVDEEVSLEFFRMLREQLTRAGYEHYEISNFARAGYHSRHNSSYWQETPYLGLGPSAHSFDGWRTRRCNPSDISRYIASMAAGNPLFTEEILTDNDRYNEVIMTRLRTARGLSPDQVGYLFGKESAERCIRTAAPFIRDGLLHEETDGRIRLTEKGIFLSDRIISEFFIV
ncbi:coproporphyrinogen III oxidase [Porphyromonas gulae]|uniref:radical SAM family heme chaperone HemW n=1 Tax=Porphyromonas gulae TaxID=111105 RepID=UPI00052BCC33|nr:radical SAM family heme chaperone HemW [Porphyromonas gulae]KGN72019.1 coproporphyrinogen III oxidase [Porphyromonas gulae]KGO03841.1 coproporphyrinogen III oxidase [Porphyromonas gulae]